MKKFLVFLIVLAIGVGGVYAFMDFEKTEEIPVVTPQEIAMEKKIGIVSKEDGAQATEGASQMILLTEDSQTIVLTSAEINLKKYLRRRVEIEGKFADPVPTPRTAFIVSDIVTLGNELQQKTVYQDDEMGIKFAYPSIWEIQKQEGAPGFPTVIITPYEVSDEERSSVDQVRIARVSNIRRAPVREFLNLDESYKPASAANATTQTQTGIVYQASVIGASQMPAVKKTADGGETVTFYVGRDAYIYSFEQISVDDAESDTYKNVFFDLVASFEFIPLKAPTTTKPDSSASTPPPPTPVTRPTPPTTPTPEPSPPASPAVPALPAPVTPPASSADVRSNFATHIKANISSLAPEAASLGGTWYVTSMGFAYPGEKPEEFTGIYVVYEDGHDRRRLLLDVPDRSSPSTMSVSAYFKPGESTDWALASGTDNARGFDKTIVVVQESGEQRTEVKKGMTLLDAKSFKVKIQYPSSWYWASAGGSYNFSTEPVSASNVKLRFQKVAGPLAQPSDGVATSIPDIAGRKAHEVDKGDTKGLCVESLQGAAHYCIYGAADARGVMQQMLETLEE